MKTCWSHQVSLLFVSYGSRKIEMMSGEAVDIVLHFPTSNRDFCGVWVLRHLKFLPFGLNQLCCWRKKNMLINKEGFIFTSEKATVDCPRRLSVASVHSFRVTELELECPAGTPHPCSLCGLLKVDTNTDYSRLLPASCGIQPPQLPPRCVSFVPLCCCWNGSLYVGLLNEDIVPVMIRR